MVVLQLFLFDNENCTSKLCPCGKEAYPSTEFEKINTNNLQMQPRSSNQYVASFEVSFLTCNDTAAKALLSYAELQHLF